MRLVISFLRDDYEVVRHRNSGKACTVSLFLSICSHNPTEALPIVLPYLCCLALHVLSAILQVDFCSLSTDTKIVARGIF